jgi:hypothetical protein
LIEQGYWQGQRKSNLKERETSNDPKKDGPARQQKILGEEKHVGKNWKERLQAQREHVDLFIHRFVQNGNNASKGIKKERKKERKKEKFELSSNTNLFHSLSRS